MAKGLVSEIAYFTGLSAIILHYFLLFSAAMLRLSICLSLLLIVAMSATAADLSELRGLVDDKQYGPAVIVGEQLVAETPADRDTLFLTAYALQMTQQAGKASAIYRQLINLYPQLPEPRNNLAIILMQQEKYQEAASLLVEALNTHPSYATSYRNLNEIYKGIASQAYQRALSEQQKPDSLNGSIQLDAIAQIKQFSSPTQLAAVDASDNLPSARPAIEEPIIEEPVSDTAAVETFPAQTESLQKPITEVTVAAATAVEETLGEEPVTTKETIETTPTVAPEVSVVETSGIDIEPEVTAPEVVATVAMVTPVIEASEINKPEEPKSVDEILQARIVDWASAWSSKAFADYISFYTSDFSPRFETHGAWVEHRRQRIMRPGDINVEVNNIQIRARSDNRAVIDFEQRYESSNYRDRVIKRIVMGRFDKTWKITAERVLSVL